VEGSAAVQKVYTSKAILPIVLIGPSTAARDCVLQYRFVSIVLPSNLLYPQSIQTIASGGMQSGQFLGSDAPSSSSRAATVLMGILTRAPQEGHFAVFPAASSLVTRRFPQSHCSLITI
jgi:hypothetical protein